MKFLPPTLMNWPTQDVFFISICVLLALIIWLSLAWRAGQRRSRAQLADTVLGFEQQREQDLARLDERQLQLTELEREASDLLNHKLQLEQQRQQSQLQLVKLEQQLQFSQQQLQTLAEKEQRLSSLQAELSSAETKLEEQKEHHEAQLQFIEHNKQQMLMQFEVLSRKVYEQQAKRFNDESNQTLQQLLNPLKTQLTDFKAKVEASHEKESAERNMLAGKISELQKQTQQIGNDAVNLAKALKGESKTQGNWGEVVLERLLEESGLQKGREYDTQVSLESADGDKRYPDVIIRLPQEKDIVVDAKVSLLDYEAHCSSDNEDEKAAALKRHVQSIRTHIAGLSLKEYERLEGIRSLDFVFLFIPVEAAFMAAIQADGRLFQDAYNKHIVLVSPTTLLASLRTVENLWRHEKQHKNAQKIADQAGGLYDQFMLMLQSLEDLGKQLDKTQAAYDTTRKRLATGRGNLLKRTQDIQKLGAKTKKALPESYQAELEAAEGLDDHQAEAEPPSLSLVSEKPEDDNAGDNKATDHNAKDKKDGNEQVAKD
ncbi:MAG: DNA recombination protein RmuC [Cellvibrionaceae bacterium]|nr:DNA recombination protein RmuC [Cellvibrionaceae bacterium]